MTILNILTVTSDLISLGDMNIDMLKQSLSCSKLKSFLSQVDLSQLICTPTWVTNTSLMMIDHIYVSNLNQYWHNGVIKPSLLDCSLVFMMRKLWCISKEEESFFI